MSHQVIWTKIILEEFIASANLTPLEEHVMRTRAAGWTITQQAMSFHVSEATVNRIVARLKKKYDAVQKYNAILPPRKESARELYMDTH